MRDVPRDSKGHRIKIIRPLIARNGKRKIGFVCNCCKGHIEHRNSNALYCKNCALYLAKIREKLNTRNYKYRKETEEWRKLGKIGRVKQKLKLSEIRKKRAKIATDKLRRKYEQRP